MGAGTFNQSGGVHNVGTEAAPAEMHVGFVGAGTYLLSSGGVLYVSGHEIIANTGRGCSSNQAELITSGASRCLATSRSAVTPLVPAPMR